MCCILLRLCTKVFVELKYRVVQNKQGDCPLLVKKVTNILQGSVECSNTLKLWWDLVLMILL